MQAKLALCESDVQCGKAYDSLTKSAVAALNCFLELKEVSIPLQESLISTLDYLRNRFLLCRWGRHC